MSDSIYNSLAKIRSIESTPQSEGIGSVLSKIGGKIIPGAGAALGAYDTAKRLKAGDKIGAGISGATAGLSSVPVIGTAAALLGTGAQAAWDKYKTGSWFPDDDEIAKGAAQQPATQTAQTAVPAGGDPKVFALQQKLITKGAKITADGKMGPATQAAMKQFPDVKMAEDNEENKMSESQKIAELMSRLAQLEQSQPQVADEGIADIAKGAWQGLKTLGKNVKGGWSGDAARTAKGTFAPAASAAGKANAVGKVAQANKGKLGLATGTVAGVGATTALSGGSATKPADGAPSAQSATAAPAAPALTPDETKELAALDAELSGFMGQDPALDDLLLKYKQATSK